MIEDNVWYRYKSYSDKRPNCYNGMMKLGDICIHNMIHYGELVQLHIMIYHDNFSNKLYKDDNIEITNLSNKLIMPIIAKQLLTEIYSKGIYKVNKGIITREY